MTTRLMTSAAGHAHRKTLMFLLVFIIIFAASPTKRDGAPCLPPLPLLTKAIHETRSATGNLDLSHQHQDVAGCRRTLRPHKRYLTHESPPCCSSDAFWEKKVNGKNKHRTSASCLLHIIIESKPVLHVWNVEHVNTRKHVTVTSTNKNNNNNNNSDNNSRDDNNNNMILFHWWSLWLNLYFLKHHSVYVFYREKFVN